MVRIMHKSPDDRAVPLDQFLAKIQASLEVLLAVKRLRAQRRELLRQVAELDTQLGALEAPLRQAILDCPTFAGPPRVHAAAPAAGERASRTLAVLEHLP